MSASHRYICGALLLTTMIAHKGENVIIGSRIVPIKGVFNLGDYEVWCVVSTITGKEEIRERVQVINAEDNTVAYIIPASKTRNMDGLYFISFELWANGEKVSTNEVEQLTIID